MLNNIFADLVVILHVFFVLFVALGGLLTLWRTAIAWIHIPAVLWGAAAELFGWTCPLTHLEFMLRQGGDGAISDQGTGFIEHYIVPILYPASLTRKMQTGIGLTVLLLNSIIYLFLWYKIRRIDFKRAE